MHSRDPITQLYQSARRLVIYGAVVLGTLCAVALILAIEVH